MSENGARLEASVVVALEDEAQELRKKILKIEQLGYLDPAFDACAARERLQRIKGKLITAKMLDLIWKIYQGLHCQDDSFAGMTNSEITDAINDEMHNLLGDQWECMKQSRQDLNHEG